MEPLAVAMAGIRLGDRVVMLGLSDPVLVAQLAIKTGLTGRACAVDADRARTARAEAVAHREGALVELVTAPWLTLPLDDESFDVAVVRNVLSELDASRRQGGVREVHRLLRAGGRCLVIDQAPRGGLGALIGGGGSAAKTDYIAGGGSVALLQSAGFRAVRTVAEREGLVFVEGVRANRVTART